MILIKQNTFLKNFSNNETIDEYLTYCPSKFNVNYCMELIKNSFYLILKNTDTTNENIFLFLFMNTWLANLYWKKF